MRTLWPVHAPHVAILILRYLRGHQAAYLFLQYQPALPSRLINFSLSVCRSHVAKCLSVHIRLVKRSLSRWNESPRRPYRQCGLDGVKIFTTFPW